MKPIQGELAEVGYGCEKHPSCKTWLDDGADTHSRHFHPNRSGQPFACRSPFIKEDYAADAAGFGNGHSAALAKEAGHDLQGLHEAIQKDLTDLEKREASDAAKRNRPLDRTRRFGIEVKEKQP